MYDQQFGGRKFGNSTYDVKPPTGDGFGGGFGGGMRSYGSNEIGANVRSVDWNRVNLQPVKKDIYEESEEVAKRPKGEIDAWLSKNEVVLQGDAIPRPIMEFKESQFSAPIMKLLYKYYAQPTVIQAITWPVALSGRDLISIAKTGSGKTLGFILPAICHITAQPPRQPGDGPIVLVLLPTRELAQQVEQVTKEYCKEMNLQMCCCFGGASKIPQAESLRSGVDICIATPGRLLDFLEGRYTNLTRCSYLVLDEADRMLDMGFEPQIRKIVSNVRPDRQTLMFSATWPKDVRDLAKSFQPDPVFLNVGSLSLSANHNISQYVEVIQEFNKPERLYQLLSYIGEQAECKTMIFVETKRKADELAYEMRKGGWPALCIHGDKSQSERDYVMAEFRSGRIPILLATDVAARGLDVDDIKYVINYDYPKNSEDYVHRIGRTGRRDKTGISYTFFTSANSPKARDLIQVLKEAHQEVPDQLLNMSSYGGGGSGYSYGSGRNNGYSSYRRS